MKRIWGQRRLAVALFCGSLLTGCDEGSVPARVNKSHTIHPLAEVNAGLAFTCRHESIPEASQDSDILFKYARWLQKNNQLKNDPAVNAQIERLYRIAAENGHYKASINLQNGALRGQFHLSGAERLRFSQALIDAGTGSGYYFIAIYLQNGSAGLKQDEEMALRYYRKAADEGHPQAQSYIGKKLAPVKMAPEISRQLRHCAAAQGDGEAALALGIDFKNEGEYQKALNTFQMGTAAGNENAASFLEHSFEGPTPDNSLYYLGQQKDLERAKRYEKIGYILSRYSYAHPTVPEINEIVPLPPAPLPAWNGSIKWRLC